MNNDFFDSVKKGNIIRTILLLDKGIDINIKDENDKNAIYYSLKYKLYDMFVFLTERGCSVCDNITDIIRNLQFLTFALKKEIILLDKYINDIITKYLFSLRGNKKNLYLKVLYSNDYYESTPQTIKETIINLNNIGLKRCIKEINEYTEDEVIGFLHTSLISNNVFAFSYLIKKFNIKSGILNGFNYNGNPEILSCVKNIKKNI